MELPNSIVSELRNLVHELVIGRYQQLEVDGRAGRLTANELKKAITRYSVHLLDLPDEAFALAHVYRIEEGDTWMIDLPLWTVEEGRSDLTLQVTSTFDGERWKVAIDDLHVM